MIKELPVIEVYNTKIIEIINEKDDQGENTSFSDVV